MKIEEKRRIVEATIKTLRKKGLLKEGRQKSKTEILSDISNAILLPMCDDLNEILGKNYINKLEDKPITTGWDIKKGKCRIYVLINKKITGVRLQKTAEYINKYFTRMLNSALADENVYTEYLKCIQETQRKFSVYFETFEHQEYDR